MSTERAGSKLEQLAAEIEKTLIATYGPIVGGGDLRRALGYTSTGALRQAVYRQTVPVQMFNIDNRRGRFALARDIAHWLASERLKVGIDDGE